MSSLSHHGIKGQRWGVRRYQNKDGTRTAAGKKHEKTNRLIASTSKDYSSITKSLSDHDLKMLNYDDEEIKYMREHETLGHDHAEYGMVAHRVIQKDKNGTPVAYVDATGFTAQSLLTGKKAAKIISIDLATRAGDEYRGKGYAIAAGKKMVKWFDTYGYKDYEYMEWAAKEENVASQKTAEKLGFRKLDVHDEGWTLYAYEHKAKHTSIGGTMYIEGNALILGDSSYLEHHGIRGQRWGVRRFQNRDGSLTNAGRKRLGYATKGAAQTVGKAFKAGVKAGGNAVKAVKAHHEKKEAEKLEKKKEKASKTRIGVMANKDLFTNEEIRKLNERFKLEDEMKMATLQKGVEIAKAVGTIAQNVGTVAKTYEDVTGQSLSPIKRKAAEEKARQDKEDRERRIAREDADEARKAAKEERDIAIHEQTLRKAIASADTQEFTAQKTKAEADSSILDLYKKGQDFNGGSDATGQSWVEKAKSGGKNPFDDMIADRDPEYAQIRKEHDEKVARKERMEYLDKHIAEREREKQAEKEARDQTLRDQTLGDMINQSNARTGRGQPKTQEPTKSSKQDSDALFSQKGSLPIDKDRYRNNRAMEKAKQVKEDAAEERAKKQDEKAVNRTIDDTIEANRSFKETVRAQDPHAYDRGVAKDYIKGKLNNLPNTLADLNPINRAAKKIADKAAKEEEAQVRKSMKDQYDRMVKSDGRDEANYVMYQTRVANLQQQGYSERKAKQIADSDPTFSAKRNRKVEYSQKVKDLDDTHRKNAKEINKANKELTDYYYKLVNGPGYDPGTPKREELDRKYRQKRGELERLEKDNNEMLEKGMKEAKKILEHSFSIQNGVLFVDSSDGFAHHGIKGQRWGVRRFQNPDGSLTDKGRKHYEKAIAKEKRKQVSSDAIRGTLERQHPFAVTGAAIMGAVAAGMSIAATGGASVAMIAAGSAISAAVSAGLTHVSYSASEAWEGRGTRMRSKKIAKYESMLKQSSMEEGMYHVENGTLFINAGEPYLEHHGVLGMKWGKHLRAGKGPADSAAGGGGGEDDEKLKEMAKKAGMSVAEYKQKFASKIGGAGKAIYNVAGGSHKTEAAEYRKLSRDASNEARKYEASGNADLAKAASARRKGNTSAHSSYKTTGDNAKNEARKARERASALSEGARQEQARYEKSLAGRYDKMKTDRARKKSIKKRQSIERALSNGPVEAKPKKSLGKRLEEKLGVTHEKTNKPKQSKEAKRIENMYKNAARKDGMQAKRKKRVAKHSDDTNAIYTEGTRLVINSKWG